MAAIQSFVMNVYGQTYSVSGVEINEWSLMLVPHKICTYYYFLNLKCLYLIPKECVQLMLTLKKYFLHCSKQNI